MDNLLYLHNPGERCKQCGGTKYVSAVYLEQSTTGWHIMIEERCHDCDLLSVTDVPLDDAIKDALRGLEGGA